MGRGETVPLEEAGEGNLFPVTRWVGESGSGREREGVVSENAYVSRCCHCLRLPSMSSSVFSNCFSLISKAHTYTQDSKRERRNFDDIEEAFIGGTGEACNSKQVRVAPAQRGE